jgi:hypothetical protein
MVWKGCAWILGKWAPSWGPGNPACQEGEKVGSWHQTVEEDRHSGMCQDAGGGLVTSTSHVYAQSECHCALYNNCHIKNQNRNRAYCVICFRKINHLVVKHNLHSSSGVREVVSSAVKLVPMWVHSHFTFYRME